MQTDYYSRLAAAFVRGSLMNAGGIAGEFAELLEVDLGALVESDFQRLMALGQDRALKLHKFKRTAGLARVCAVLGILHGLQPSEILDIGTGRGVFLWPFLDAFPSTPITCVDSNPLRVRDINAVRDGGIATLCALESDIARVDIPAKSVDVVTFLEVLEHIPDPQEALNKACSIAKRFIVISVPSHEDDNEEHIHLFNQASVGQMLTRAGAHHANFQWVLNHMIVVAKV